MMISFTEQNAREVGERTVGIFIIHVEHSEMVRRQGQSEALWRHRPLFSGLAGGARRWGLRMDC